MRNIALIVAAVAALAVAFVVARGGDDPAREAAEVTPAIATVTSEPASTAPETSTSPTAPRKAPAAASEPAPPTVVFVGGAPRRGVKRLAFGKGDQVRFRVRSDVDEEIHVHGFDEYADVQAGRSVTLSFPAEFDGIFDVEMHGSGTQIASLVIQP